MADQAAPHVVLFRPNPIDRDTRAKKIALSLHRAGYQVTVVSMVPLGSPLEEQSLAGVRVVPVLLRTTQKDLRALQMSARRRRTYRPLVRMTEDEYRTRIAERRSSQGRAMARANRARAWMRSGPPHRRAVGLLAWPPLRALALLSALWGRQLRVRMERQARLNAWTRRTWKRFDSWRAGTALWATDRGALPELEDVASSLGPVLDRLAPDVLHAHHPLVLPVAVRAARRLRARGRSPRVVYDARENYAGIPEQEQGSARRHAVLVRQEARTIRHVDAVITVSEPIAHVLQERYALPRLPTVLLNVPVLQEPAGGPTVRDEAGLAQDVPLVVYSGAMSRARGIETLVDALPHVPHVHLAIVSVPFPHPMTPALQERAQELGVADRLHVLAPVGQDRLVGFLSGADVAVHPLPGGSPNHDQALPNKLFEYLHAGLPLVVSDAREMAAFVHRHDLGEVFTSGDPEALGAALQRALGRTIDAGARRTTARAFSWQAQEETVHALYREIAPVDAPEPEGSFPSLDVVAAP